MIHSLTLKNWMCFRSEHTINLGPGAYAITAHHEADAGRSNYSGKSALFEAIDFALTGRLAKFRRFDADGWITRGEAEGSVAVTLEGGFTITRERRRGRSTQVSFTFPDGVTATQDDAAAAILKHLGFDADDFRHVAYFEQKQMSRLVLIEPEKRLDIVRGWLGLERAEQAETLAGERASERLRHLETAKARLALLEEQLPAAEAMPDPAKLSLAITRATIELTAARTAREAAREASQAARDAEEQRVEDEATLAEYDRILTAGKLTAASVAKIPKTLDEDAAAARKAFEVAVGNWTLAYNETQARARVALGQFDGACPVADIECPARAKINADRAASAAASARAQKARDEAGRKKDEAARVVREVESAQAEAARLRDNLDSLREEARALVPEVKAARARLAEKGLPLTTLQAGADLDQLDFAVETAAATLAEAREHKAQAERAAAERAASLAAIDGIKGAIAKLTREASIATRARGVLRAAQRRVGERALAAINAWASTMLAEAGIDLSVALTWEREGKGPAKQCEECGAAFPSSAKVKTCATCGAERGLLIVQRLEFVPSDRSGAADDVAGVALQLAAGAWLLQARQSPFACCLLDEPLGATDATNGRALSKKLMLLASTASVWRQVFVISHSKSTVDIFPHRIEIVVDKNGERSIHLR